MKTDTTAPTPASSVSDAVAVSTIEPEIARTYILDETTLIPGSAIAPGEEPRGELDRPFGDAGIYEPPTYVSRPPLGLFVLYAMVHGHWSCRKVDWGRGNISTMKYRDVEFEVMLCKCGTARIGVKSLNWAYQRKEFEIEIGTAMYDVPVYPGIRFGYYWQRPGPLQSPDAPSRPTVDAMATGLAEPGRPYIGDFHLYVKGASSGECETFVWEATEGKKTAKFHGTHFEVYIEGDYRATITAICGTSRRTWSVPDPGAAMCVAPAVQLVYGLIVTPRWHGHWAGPTLDGEPLIMEQRACPENGD